MTDERFFADHMLGKLSKWLRMMGFDVAYPQKDMTDSEIMEVCDVEARILLTRDHELYSRYARSVLIRSGNFKSQVVQFIAGFPPHEERYFTRCTECNALLTKEETEAAAEGVPDSVRERGLTVWSCRNCGKVYWKGTHYDRILRQIRKFEAEIK